MPDLDGFAPIVSKQAKVLILGTMPSVASLAKQQYYGHPRNGFWPIMDALFAIDVGLCYSRRKALVLKQGLAIWDVIRACHRPGSSDSDIELSTLEVNQFEEFFTEYQSIKVVFFNGSMAEKLYRRYCLPGLNKQFSYLRYQRLPSTSPANAALNWQQKLEAWRVVKLSVRQ